MLEGLFMLGSLIVLLLLISSRNSNRELKRKWKIRRGGDHSRIYIEVDPSGGWRQITFRCEPYAKHVPRHALYLSKDWKRYPEWAQSRKDEIMDRIKSELKEPEYTIVEVDEIE
jgi:hypothetical protein